VARRGAKARELFDALYGRIPPAAASPPEHCSAGHLAPLSRCLAPPARREGTGGERRPEISGGLRSNRGGGRRESGAEERRGEE